MTERAYPLARAAKTAAFALLFAFAVPDVALSWIEYRNMTDLFSINFPREPDVREFVYTSEYGAMLPAREYYVEDAGSSHSLIVIDYNDAVDKYSEIADKTDDTSIETMWIYDQRGAVINEAARMRKAAAEVLYDGWHHIDRVEGMNLVLRNADDTTTYAALYLHARRLYILTAVVPDGAPAGGLFQQSLTFLDEDGNKIRYWITPEGERSREQ